MATPPIHLEIYDGRTFCGEDSIHYVDQSDWHTRASVDLDGKRLQWLQALMHVTCPDCLEAVATLGRIAESVRIKLKETP